MAFLWLSVCGRAEPAEQWLLLSPLKALLLTARAGEDLRERSEDADSDVAYTVPKRIMCGILGRQDECWGLSFPYFPACEIEMVSCSSQPPPLPGKNRILKFPSHSQNIDGLIYLFSLEDNSSFKTKFGFWDSELCDGMMRSRMLLSKVAQI